MLSEFGYTNDIQETPSQVRWEGKIGECFKFVIGSL